MLSPNVTTLYVSTGQQSPWHILRPNEANYTWCQVVPSAHAWADTTLNMPTSICPSCASAEAASLASDLDRAPGVPGSF
jgi:hypothetical protein